MTKPHPLPLLEESQIDELDPPIGKLPDNLNADAVLQAYLDNLTSLESADFHEHAAWRDFLVFTNTIRTFNTKSHVHATWRKLCRRQLPTDFRLVPETSKAVQLGPVAFLTSRFTFKTRGELEATSNTGIIFLVPQDDDTRKWQLWVLNTYLGHAKALGNPDELQKVSGTVSNFKQANKTSEEPMDVVVIGAGQSGLNMLGRLKALNLRAVALEKNRSVGDNWTNRYDSAKLHLNKWYANMPWGNTFNDNSYPYFLTAADLSRGFQQFVEDYGLDVRTSTEVKSAKWDADSRLWTVSADRHNGHTTVVARHLIFAGGSDQVPYLPAYPKRGSYNGVVVHSVDYKSPKAWKGLKGVVVGTGNTAHDVAEDMVEADLASVTLVQRSPTIIVPFSFLEHNHNHEYNETANLYASDQMSWGLPNQFYDSVPPYVYDSWVKKNPQTFDGLEKRGFGVVRPPIKLMKRVRERAGGHYLDVGCCQKIVDGEVAVKQGEIESYTPTGLRFTDGSTLDADVIVWSTGFRRDIANTLSKIVGQGVGSQLSDFLSWNKEGEQPGFYRQQKHSAIWYAVGELAMARLYGRFLALMIKADIAHVPLKPYMED